MDDATTYPLAAVQIPEDRAAEFAPRTQWSIGKNPEERRALLEVALGAKMGPKSSAIEAYANHGRWVVECPDCHSAQLASKADPRFMCCDCGNASIQGRWRPIVWPAKQRLRQIESLLDERAQAAHRSWTPGETTTQLRVENKLLKEAR